MRTWVRSVLSRTRIKAWVNSFVAGLFYKGMRTTFSSDNVIYSESPDLDKYEPGDPQIALATVADRFLNDIHGDIITDQAFACALMYPEIAFKMGCDERLGEHPFNKVWLEVVPPWELVMDRKVANPRFMRYIGHTYYMPIEEFHAKYGKQPHIQAYHPARCARGRLLLGEHLGGRAGLRPYSGMVRPYRHLRCYRRFQSQGHHARLRDQRRGRMRTLRFTATQVGKDEAIPYSWPDGTPAPPVIPVVLENVPEYPLEGISSVGNHLRDQPRAQLHYHVVS